MFRTPRPNDHVESAETRDVLGGSCCHPLNSPSTVARRSPGVLTEFSFGPSLSQALCTTWYYGGSELIPSLEIAVLWLATRDNTPQAILESKRRTPGLMKFQRRRLMLSTLRYSRSMREYLDHRSDTGERFSKSCALHLLPLHFIQRSLAHK